MTTAAQITLNRIYKKTVHLKRFKTIAAITGLLTTQRSFYIYSIFALQGTSQQIKQPRGIER
jgi:hypothetical protein